MRLYGPAFTFLALVSGAGTAVAVNPPVAEIGSLVLHSTHSEVTGRDSGAAEQITDVVASQTLTITGDYVMRANAPETLQVVLALANAEDAASPGYRAVVATDQEFGSTGLQVRVPNMPEAANHIFQVKVFQLGALAPRVCDAGSIRIGGETPGKLG